ncbi:MAG: hypothetical protein HY048_18815 [Acidobacteria bacterium]|nr:hypothetical protein [Acidobacteriota bacterium]
MTLVTLQAWLVRTFARGTVAAAFMRTHWGWPAAESVHFIGLSLLFGTIVVWDLRLLGVGKRIPLAALHVLLRWTGIGFALSAGSGVMFLMTEPTEYIYNPSFHFKMVCLAIAGVNALAFYATGYGRAVTHGAPEVAPRNAKLFAVISLLAWLGVIVFGRLLTFYRPAWCDEKPTTVVARCVPSRSQQ